MICSSCRLATTAPRTTPNTKKFCRRRRHERSGMMHGVISCPQVRTSHLRVSVLRRRNLMRLLAVFALGLLMPVSAHGACCYFSAKNTDILQPAQKVFRSEEHTSELQSRGLISYPVFCL